MGGVIGGIVLLSALVMLLLFFRRRKRFHQQQARTDLFTDDEGPNNEAQGANGQLAPSLTLSQSEKRPSTEERI